MEPRRNDALNRVQEKQTNKQTNKQTKTKRPQCFRNAAVTAGDRNLCLAGISFPPNSPDVEGSPPSTS